ncbi:MAG: GNAT family N-acetyltransferase [Thermoplasmata archaeon]|nr:GNAT family N-acetyltransferase [Thermoplasmata archaeon]
MTGRPVPTLEGRSVRLRAPLSTDLPVLFEWYNDPETVAPFDRFSLDSFSEFESGVQKAPDDPQSLAPRFVVERIDGPLTLGFVGYYSSHPVLELVDVWYVLGERAARGKGYGLESVGLLVDYLFHTFEYARVGATCDVENVPSYRLLERLKFVREGTLRQALFHHGAWHDVAVYGVTRREWAEHPRPP